MSQNRGGAGIHDTGLPFDTISLNSGIAVYGIIIKRPFQSSDPLATNDEYADGLQRFEHEKNIYRRLEGCEGVIPYLDLSGPAIPLPLLSDGTLHSYLKNNPRFTRARRVKWAQQIAKTLARLHDRRVLFVDVASRNMLIYPDGSIVFCDFGTSLIFSMDTDIWTTEQYGFSFSTDICELGAVIYEIVEGRELIDFDRITEEAGGWPPRDQLPSTDGVFLGSVIEACWTKGKVSNHTRAVPDAE
ncbi:hypothetical protein RBB50_008174 [Rhinocladiella similis]